MELLKNVSINVTVNVQELVESIQSSDEALSIIKQLDLNQADVDFTTNLIRELILGESGLVNDYDKEEVRDFLKEIREELK